MTGAAIKFLDAIAGGAVQFLGSIAGSGIAFPGNSITGATIAFDVNLPDGADFDATDFAADDFATA